MLLLMLMLFNAVDAGVDGATAMVLLSLLPLFHVPEACCGQEISLAKIPKEKAFRVSMWKHDNMMGSLPHFGRCTSDSIITIITTVIIVITIMNHDRYYYHYSHHYFCFYGLEGASSGWPGQGSRPAWSTRPCKAQLIGG